MGYQPFGLNTIQSFLQGTPFSNIHTGSWGTPDLGVSENLAKLTGVGLNSQGGSNFSNTGKAVGNVLGVSTNTTPTYSQAPGASFNTGTLFGPAVPTGGGAPTPSGAVNQNVGTYGPTLPDNSGLVSSIGSAWDSYINQLNSQLESGLPAQQAAQQQQVQGSYDQALNQLGTQKQQSTEALNKQQASSLKDLSSNIRNLFQGGNTYLGALGAGDSSAANQYSYAISKMGTKQRGDIMSQAQSRMQQIGDIYNSEKNNLDAQKTTQLGQIAQWFASAQDQLRSQLGQAGISKQTDINNLSQQLYNQALQAVQNVQSQIANQQNILTQWAANNSTNVQGFISNMQQIQQAMPQFQPMNAVVPQTASAGPVAPTGYGGTTTTDQNSLYKLLAQR